MQRGLQDDVGDTIQEDLVVVVVEVVAVDGNTIRHLVPNLLQDRSGLGLDLDLLLLLLEHLDELRVLFILLSLSGEEVECLQETTSRRAGPSGEKGGPTNTHETSHNSGKGCCGEDYANRTT